MRRRALRPLAFAVEAVARGVEPATLLAECQRVWPVVVGDVIAAEARPVAEHAGVVTIACASAVWASELDLMGPSLVDRLNEAIGRPAVQRLRCRTGDIARAP